MLKTMYAEGKRLLLFDGVCNFCNSTVLFIVDRDPRERFVFAALQSDLGAQTLRDHGLLAAPRALGAAPRERTADSSSTSVQAAEGRASAAHEQAAEGQSTDGDLDSIVLIEGGRAYTRSTAALLVARGMKWPWPLLYYLLIWVPASVRDVGYRYFASHRYAWFGKSDQCRIPTPELRRRILTASTTAT